jgi:glycine betaine/proline transport system permease protein
MGVWDDTMTTLAIVVISVLVSLLIGIPLGISAARSDRVYGVIRPILDFMQTMPSFVYLLPAVFFFGLGKVPAVVATFIYAVPPCIRLTNLGIRQVPAETVEAGKAFGTTAWQLLLKIQLPLAIPNIMAGINQTIMMALAMVVICSMIGTAGLGLEVLTGIQRLDLGRAFIAGISIVIMAMILDRITQSLGAARDTSARRN